MEKLEVVKNNALLALENGDSFYWDENSNMYVYSSTDEEVSEDSFKRTSNKVMLSKDIMDSLIENGVVIDGSKEVAMPTESDLPEYEECESCKNSREAIDSIDWEAYDLGLQLKQMLEENDYGRKSE
jgi:hypothetical protein